MSCNTSSSCMKNGKYPLRPGNEGGNGAAWRNENGNGRLKEKFLGHL